MLTYYKSSKLLAIRFTRGVRMSKIESALSIQIWTLRGKLTHPTKAQRPNWTLRLALGYADVWNTSLNVLVDILHVFISMQAFIEIETYIHIYMTSGQSNIIFLFKYFNHSATGIFQDEDRSNKLYVLITRSAVSLVAGCPNCVV